MATAPYHAQPIRLPHFCDTNRKSIMQSAGQIKVATGITVRHRNTTASAAITPPRAMEDA